MRFILILLVLFISCSKKNEAEKSETKFQKINYSLKYNYLDSIGKKIVPNDNFQYWLIQLIMKDMVTRKLVEQF